MPPSYGAHEKPTYSANLYLRSLEKVYTYLQDLKILATTVQGFYATTVLECYALDSTTLLKNKIFEGELYLRL